MKIFTNVQHCFTLYNVFSKIISAITTNLFNQFELRINVGWYRILFQKKKGDDTQYHHAYQDQELPDQQAEIIWLNCLLEFQIGV